MSFGSTAFAAAGLMLMTGMAMAGQAEKTACDFSDIEEFVAWFGGSVAHQQSATSNPLDAAFLDMSAKPVPKLDGEMHAHEELGWPILPDLAGLIGSYKMTYTEIDADTVEFLTKGGQGVHITYTFQKQPCWTLIKLVDETPS